MKKINVLNVPALIVTSLVFSLSFAEENTVSQDECMQLFLERIKDCFGEVEQANQMCEESFCSAPISSESQYCLHDTLCDIIASSITHKISIYGIARKS